eukprot:GFUD01008317.1.p1 GENE.GFUD01008317.1~~GFUD01008317.1.p1  ORF type:complete len:703 (+),score=116.08 GFUD01008317.1:215-2323(+)
MSCLFSYITRVWRRKPALLGLVVLVLIFLTCAYRTTDKENTESIYAEGLVGIHKKLQQVNDNNFEAVKFLPAVVGNAARPNNFFQNPQQGKIHKAMYGEQHRQAKVVNSHQQFQAGGDENLEYDRHDDMAPDMRAPGGQRVPIYYPQGQNQQVENGGKIDSDSAQLRLSGQQMAQNEVETTPTPLYIPPQRIVHLDLKGAPPSIQYIKKILTLSQGLGATGVLVEWEDMFPWSGRLSSVAAKNHYTHTEVEDLLKTCQELGLEVIPLVQTFGHLEFILKHEEFSYLRDVEEMPESICPCHNDTMGLVREIVDQVMAVHKKAKYLHIGCDEVFHLGECSQCLGNGRTSIFIDHVTRVAKYVNITYKVTPIIWDDMLRNFIVEEMQPLANLVEPMVWVYAEDVERFVPSYTWDRYNQVFDYFWTASAFKGAHGETLVVPDVQRHLNNNLNWLALMAQEEPRMRGGFRGIVLTGWQRYDHFAVLCELLPAAIPSLAVNLVATTNGFFNETLGKPLFKALGCVQHSGKYNSFVDLESDNFLWDKLSWCFFPGTNFFKVTKNLVSTEIEVRDFLHKVEKKKGWLTEYNRRHNMSSPFRIDEGLEDWSRFQHEVVSLMRNANTALSEMFDHYTVSEWIEQKLYPMYSKLSHIRNEADSLRRVKSWPSRPYEPLEALKGLGIGVEQTPESAAVKKVRPTRGPDYYSNKV